MKKEDQVANVELSKELKDLGVKQDSVWFWNSCITSRLYLSVDNPLEDRLTTDGTYLQYSLSAYTVAELGKMLPYKIEGEYFLRTGKTERYYQVSYFDLDLNQKHTEFEEKEADARAKMLIYLIKEGGKTANDIK